MSAKYHVQEEVENTPRSDVGWLAGGGGSDDPSPSIAPRAIPNVHVDTVELTPRARSPTDNGDFHDLHSKGPLLSPPHAKGVGGLGSGPYQSDASRFVNTTPSRTDHVAVSMHAADRAPNSPEYEHSRSLSSRNQALTLPDSRAPRPSTMVRRSSTLLQPPTLLAKLDTDIDGSNDPPPGFIRPNSMMALAWSYFIMMVSLYNVISIPYRIAFWSDPIAVESDVITFIVLDAIGDCCCFFDVYSSLRTGYSDNGIIIYDKEKIWQRYRNSWFIVDLITCIPTDFIQLGFMRIIPWVRIAKVLRLFQLLHHYNKIEDNTTVSLQFRVAKLLFYTGILSHFAACIKYHVILNDHATNEIRITLLEKTGFGRYLQCLYWSTGAMTGRDDTDPPETLMDAGFTVFMMVVGILWLAFIIASLETFAHDDNNSGARFQAKVGYVTQFMHQFNLPKEIQDKVKAYYSYLWSSSLRFETDHFLHTLPVTLQADVNLSMNRVIENAEIFADVDSGFLAYIVHSITTTVSIPGEIICSVDLAGPEMWFISEGEVEILIGPKLASIAKLRQGDYFGEYAIFTSPVRTSTARSISYCTLLVLSAANLTGALALFPNSNAAVRAHVEEHRQKTLLQERNFLGLDSGAGGKKGRGNDKLKKLITVDEQVAHRESEVWTLSPTSRFYQRWQAVYFLVMFWNAIVLPLRIGFFEHDVNAGVMTIDYLGDAFLIADIALNFRLRFVQGGGEISDTRLIAQRYIYGWFFPFVIASIPLDFIMIVKGMYPLLRLNRILRLAHVHTELVAKLKNATHYGVLSLLYLVMNFLFLSHWAASVYFSFTLFEGFEDDEDGEPDYLGWRPASVIEVGPVIYQYLQSQYFAMALLAGIGRHVYPPSNYDVILSLSVMLTGVFVVSYLIGKVGHLIFNLNASAAEFKAETAFVTQLLDYRKVSPDVALRVTEYMRHIWTSQKGIDPNVALAGLPRQIRTDIMMHICEGMIRKVPRFRDLDNSFVRQLVSELTFVELPAGEFVFRQGQIGDSMYFVSVGLVEILFDAVKEDNLSGAGTPPVNSHQLKIIGEGSFFGEGALFSGTRAASIRSRTPVRLLALSETSFQKVMHVHPHFAEKIMFLNAERQRRIEEKVVAAEAEHIPPQTSTTHNRPKHRHAPSIGLSLAPGGGVDGISPRAPGSTRKSVFRAFGHTTGLASQVEKLIAAEKEKERVRRSATTQATPLLRSASLAAISTAANSAASTSVGTLPPSASTPAMASVAATASRPVTSSQWTPITQQPLTITTNTGPRHDMHATGPHSARAATLYPHEPHTAGVVHIPSDADQTGSVPPTPLTMRGSPTLSPVDHERNLHAGVPPGFSGSDDEPVSPIARPQPDQTQPKLLNPTRASTSTKNAPAAAAAAAAIINNAPGRVSARVQPVQSQKSRPTSARGAQAAHSSTHTAASAANTPSPTAVATPSGTPSPTVASPPVAAAPQTHVGAVGFPVSRAVVTGGITDEPAAVGFPRDPMAAAITNTASEEPIARVTAPAAATTAVPATGLSPTAAATTKNARTTPSKQR